MKKILKNKKLLLTVLSVVLLLILFTKYIKTREVNFDLIFEPEDTINQKEIFFENDKKNNGSQSGEKDKGKEKIKIESKKNQKKETEAEIESIALIRDIKDPFQEKADNFKLKAAEAEKQNANTKNKLIYLEKNIIAENIISKNKEADIDNDSIIELDKKSLLETKNGRHESNTSERQFKNIKLPFKLLGIIKNRDNSSALFLYQGQNILKKEKENIDIFKIEEINNNNLVLSCENHKRQLYLWEGNNDEI